jgi:hypothetical protein
MIRAAAVVLVALGVIFGLASCGDSSERGSPTTPTNDPTGTTSASDDLTGCLIGAGFIEPANLVATVEIDGVERVAALAFPPPHSDDDYLVVYEAPDDSSAAKAAAEFAGGPFIEQVDSLLYTVAGANDPLTPRQSKDISECLRQ